MTNEHGSVDRVGIGAYDTINTLVILADKAWHQMDGPFEITSDGARWGVRLPAGDDPRSIEDWEIEQLTSYAEGNEAIAIADGDILGYGVVVGADMIEGDVSVSVQHIARAD